MCRADRPLYSGHAQWVLIDWHAMVEDHEEAFIKAFVLRRRRGRFLLAIHESKNRWRFLEKLPHLALEERFLSEVRGHESRPDQIEARLRLLGAPTTCFVVSEFDARCQN